MTTLSATKLAWASSLVWSGVFFVLGCAPSESVGQLRSERPKTQTEALSFAEAQKLSGSDGVEGQMIGDSVAVDGDRALIGCIADLGAVWAFSRSGGVWREDQKFTPDVTTGMPYYGWFVALDGNRALIGAPHMQVGTNARQGAVYVMEHDGSSWEEVDVLGASDGGADHYLGYGVALRGTTAFARGGAGAYYVFEHDGSRFQERQILTASDGAPLDAVVALDATTAVIGASYADGFRGAVYVFSRGAAGFTETQRIVANNRVAESYFGASVALEGDRLLVGASMETALAPWAGAAYVFTRSNGGFTFEQRVQASDGENSGLFGTAVALRADLLAIAAPQAAPSGAVYLFEPSGGTWQETRKIVTSDAGNGDAFGQHMAFDEQTLLVSSRSSDFGDNVNQGAVYAFSLVGQDCQTASDCESGHCVDGVCCDTACAGACDVCSVELGAEAGGHCVAAPAGSPGGPACAPLACTGESVDCEACVSDDECATGRYCSAEGRCENRKDQGASCDVAAGMDCAEDDCRACASGLTCVDGVCCDEACSGSCDACSAALGATEDGTCTVLDTGPGEPVCAGGFGCDGSGEECPDSCDDDTSCRPSHYCTEQGSCAPRACTSARDCSGSAPNCVDGICCDQPCDGQCEACDVAGREGVCSAVEGAPHGDRPECASAGEECGGECDGLDASRCHFRASGATCGGDVICNDATALGSACDGEGACVEQEPLSCEPYACTSSGCLTSCSSDADCSTGFSCLDERCVFSGGRCSEDGTDALDGDGNLVEECKPYLCVNGACEDSCASSSDCQNGFLCDTVEGTCVAESDNVATSEGCGCRLTGTERGDPRAFAALALSVLILRRRRLRKVAA